MKALYSKRDEWVEAVTSAVRRISRSEVLRRRVETWAAPAALVAQPMVFYWKVLFTRRAHIPYDIEGFHLPLIAYIGRCVRQGVAPFWDPFSYCGVPFHADSQAQLFYPLNWIAILLGNMSDGRKLYYWVEWLVPLHMILAGLFAYALLRHLGLRAPAALFGASIYQLGGYFASQAQHLGAICAGAWLPLVLLCAFKLKRGPSGRWIAILGLSLAMAVLAGFSAATLVVLGALALVTAGLLATREASWKLVPAIACGSILAVALAAVQLIPTYMLARTSVAGMRSQWLLTGGGLRLQSLASFVIPNYYHIFTPFDARYTLRDINFTFLYVYCGLAAVVLLAIAPFLRKAPHARMFFALTFLAALWMLGDDTPVYRTIFTHLPPLARAALYAEFALMAFCMFTGVTAAIALDRLGKRRGLVLWGVALLTSADLIHFGARRPMNSAPGNYKAENAEYILDGAVEPLRQLQAAVNTTLPPVRLDYYDMPVSEGPVKAPMWQLPTASGDNPFMLQRLFFLRRLFCGGNPWERQIPVNRIGSPLLDMLNAGVLAGVSALPETEVRRAGLTPLGTVDGLHLYRNPKALPRFFFVPKLYLSRGLSQTLSRLGDPVFHPAEEAVIEAPDGSNLAGPFASGVVRVDAYSPNRVDLTVRTAGRAFLASSETFYPGWTARVNGRPADFVLTNAAFRGLVLDAGESRITMTYRPVALPALALASISAVLLSLVLLGHRGPAAREVDGAPETKAQTMNDLT